MKGRHWITFASLALTLAAVQQPALAQNGDAGGGEVREDRRDLGQDRRDIREDRRDIREDRNELRGDRRDLRQDIRSGAGPGQIAQDRQDKPILDRLHTEIRKAFDDATVKAVLAKQGADPMLLDPKAFDAFLRAEVKVNAKIVEAAGIKPAN